MGRRLGRRPARPVLGSGDLASVRQRCRRIGGDDPDRLYRAGFQRLEEVNGSQTWFGGKVVDAPGLGYFCSGGIVGEFAVV